MSILDEHGLAEYTPQGAFYLLVNIAPSGLSSEAFAAMLLRTRGVAVAPGSGFGERAASHVRVESICLVSRILPRIVRLARLNWR